MKRPDNRQSFEVKAMLNEIGNQVESVLPARALESYRELIAVGEGQVALENLCTNLDDFNLELTPEVVANIRRACEHLGVASCYWERLVRGA
jgi:hypothetical protein